VDSKGTYVEAWNLGSSWDCGPPSAHRGLSRRALLRLGGLSLLAGCSPARSPEGSGPQPADDAAAVTRPRHYVAGAQAIALTIDDGPDPRWTPPVLNVLRRYGITATFCVVGRQVAQYPGLVRAISAEGHILCNHTYTHSDLAKLPQDQIRQQIERTSDAIARATGGHVPGLFRAPYGAWSQPVFTLCEQMNLRPVDWSVDPRDWARPGVSHIVRTILAQTRPGSIILEHDGGGNRAQTVTALGEVLPQLKTSGYHFVTL
jgi:peptidoglycan-N-acetylglucosamine deacetylase